MILNLFMKEKLKLISYSDTVLERTLSWFFSVLLQCKLQFLINFSLVHKIIRRLKLNSDRTGVEDIMAFKSQKRCLLGDWDSSGAYARITNNLQYREP